MTELSRYEQQCWDAGFRSAQKESSRLEAERDQLRAEVEAQTAKCVLFAAALKKADAEVVHLRADLHEARDLIPPDVSTSDHSVYAKLRDARAEVERLKAELAEERREADEQDAGWLADKDAEIERLKAELKVHAAMLIPGMTRHVHDVQQECREKKVEHITGVAIKSGDVVYRLGWPCRHCHVMHMLAQTIPDWLQQEPRHIQGFVTDAGRFVDRHEAAVIGKAAGQTIERGDEAFSEWFW